MSVMIKKVWENTDSAGQDFRTVQFSNGVRASTWDTEHFPLCKAGTEVEAEVVKRGKYHNIESMKAASGGSSGGGKKEWVPDIVRNIMQGYGNARSNAVLAANFLLSSKDSVKLDDYVKLVGTLTEKFFAKGNEVFTIALKDAKSLLSFEDEPRKPDPESDEPTIPVDMSKDASDSGEADKDDTPF